MTDMERKFIKCTIKKTGKIIYINVDRVLSVYEDNNGETQIYIGGEYGDCYIVVESVSEVMRKINGDF